MTDLEVLTAGNIVVPCIGCKEECDPTTCGLLEEWLEKQAIECKKV